MQHDTLLQSANNSLQILLLKKTDFLWSVVSSKVVVYIFLRNLNML